MTPQARAGDDAAGMPPRRYDDGEHDPALLAQGGLAKPARFLSHGGVIAAVLLNALVPGAGHLIVLRRWLAAIIWFVATVGAYVGGMAALVYAATSVRDFDRAWHFGELRLLALFLMPALIVHTWCCVSVIPSAAQRRLAIACAAAAILILVLLAPAVDLGLRRQIEAASAGASR